MKKKTVPPLSAPFQRCTTRASGTDKFQIHHFLVFSDAFSMSEATGEEETIQAETWTVSFQDQLSLFFLFPILFETFSQR